MPVPSREGVESQTIVSRSQLVTQVPLLQVPGEPTVPEKGKGKMETDDGGMSDYATQI